jgi:AcrR family transcriptional regulator
MATTTDGEDTRARILHVAMELFAEQGFAATSTRELSERLGFTKAALYYHFRTKDDLLVALVEPVLDDLSNLIAGGAGQRTPAARRALLAGYINLVSTHQHLIRVLAQDPATAHSESLKKTAVPRYEQLMQLLAGQDVPDVRTLTRARAALGGIHAALLSPQAEPADEVVRSAALDAACGALGVPAARHHA